jgi:hypothetical protein
MLLKVLGGIGALVAFCVGLWQYAKAQKWQKAQVILSLMDAFKGDQFIQAACLMLDWDKRDIVFLDGRRIAFTNAKLPSALRIMYMDESAKVPMDKSETGGAEGAAGNDFSLEETLIRDSFDRFFDFFDKLHAFRANELVSISDLRYFYYWFELIRVVGTYKSDGRIQESIDNYIETYNFRGFEELCEEYALKPEPLLPMIPKNQSTASPEIPH